MNHSVEWKVKKVLEQPLSPRHPVIFSDDDWDYNTPLAIGSMYIIFPFMYHKNQPFM